MQNYRALEDNLGENLDDLGYDDTTPKMQSMKEIMDKVDFIKIKNLCPAKDNVKRMRRQATDWEKIFVKDTSDKVLLFKIYKELLKVTNKKTTNPIKKWTKDLNRHLIKEDRDSK